MDPKVQSLITAMAGRLDAQSGLNGSVKLDFGEAGSILIDGKSTPNAVVPGSGISADCTVTLSLETFERLSSRQLDPMSAFMQGKVRIAGDMGLAMKLGPILQAMQG